MPEFGDRLKVLRWREKLGLTLPVLVRRTKELRASDPGISASEIAVLVIEESLSEAIKADPKFDWSSIDWEALITAIVTLIQLIITMFML